MLNGKHFATIWLKQNMSWLPRKADLEEKNTWEFLPKNLLYPIFSFEWGAYIGTHQVCILVWKTANVSAVYLSSGWNVTCSSVLQCVDIWVKWILLAYLNKTTDQRASTHCNHCLHALMHTVQGAWWITRS